ncbi:transcriptional repressor DicA [Psychrobacter pasteurii]|uniref:Transcriptional repressor DicA n=1 Tax=Psychrobacter pasteurii TaxID=1945520 RepID=A0A1R4EHB0_9GAMM|nr:S24 family peptidase [Psychrobacter pasteurii]SJM37833.1 transcriptional repressor DicA [Psychrobacter pasteurii]
MKLDTFRDRLIYAKDEKGLKQVDLVKATGVSKGTVSNWISGKTTPDDTVALGDLAKALGVSVDWLVTGRESKNHSFSNVRPVDKHEIRMAPVLNYVQAGEFCEYFDDAIADRFEPVSTKHPKNSYWVELNGLSMIPDFYPEELVLINPDMQPSPGDYVVAKKAGENAVTFKKWRPRGFDDEGVEYCELVPLNPDFPIIDSRHTPFTVCGVAVEHKKKLK